MSVDFIAAWTPWPHDKDGNEVADLKAHMHSRLPNINDEQLLVHADTVGLELEDAHLDDGDLTIAGRDVLLTNLKEMIDRFDPLGFRSDIAIGEIRGHRFLITGGISTGDSPTDSFDDFTALIDAGLLDDTERS